MSINATGATEKAIIDGNECEITSIGKVYRQGRTDNPCFIAKNAPDNGINSQGSPKTRVL